MHHPRMPALRSIVLVVLAVWGTSGHTAGLGSIRVQSGLGQPLRVTIPLTSDDGNEDVGSHCIKAKVESSDGVFITTPKIGLMRLHARHQSSRVRGSLLAHSLVRR